MVVNSSQGGGFKDTWVLGRLHVTRRPALVPRPPGSARQRWPRHRRPTAPANPGTNDEEIHTMSPKLNPMAVSSDPPITRAKADQLYWLGRYTERIFV